MSEDFVYSGVVDEKEESIHKLKTLKNITTTSEEIGDFKHKIRQEAIQWIKELEDCDKKGIDFCLKCMKRTDYKKCEGHWNDVLTTQDPYEPHGQQEAAKILRKIFNIEEEDLK